MRVLVLLLLISPWCWSEERPRLSLWNWSNDWTEERLHRLNLKTEKAARKKQWKTAIRLGKKTLDGCLKLYNEQDPRCIAIMKNNSVAYYRSGKSEQYAEHIAKAYQLASSELGIQHFTTIITRDIYHRLLMDQVRYEEAIPLVIEFIAIEKSMSNDEFKILDFEILLYALYKVTEQHQYEEPTLVRMLNLTEKLIGADSEDFRRVAVTLAKSYCRQKKYHEFFSFAQQHRLDIRCAE